MQRIFNVFLAVVMCQFLNAQDVKPIKIDELKEFIQSTSKPTVINFWATWCGPCIQEMPWLDKLVHQSKDVELVLISVDDNRAYPDKIQSFINAKKINATLFWLNESTPDISAIEPRWRGMIPATIFVNNKSGYKKFKEEQVSPPELRKQLRLLTRD
jgi:thiol-disulfide isomerase/thioredoxin